MTTSHDLAIEAAGLTKRFGATVALDGVDLAAARGTVLGVLGPNGAGKTTAVRVLATLLRPDGGTARIAGHDVVRDAAAVRRQIGLTGQYASVDEALTGTQNLVMIGRLLDLKPRAAKARAAELLAWFDLEDAAEPPRPHLLRRHAPAARPRREPRRPPGGRLPRRAHHRARPEQARRHVGRRPAARPPTARPSCSPPSTSRRPTSSPTTSSSSTTGRVIAHGTPEELKRIAGDQTITVRPVDPADLETVAAIVGAATGTGAEILPRGTVRAAATGDEALAAIVGRLDVEGIAVTELSLRLPSLDEVFAVLTRREAPRTPIYEEVAA